MSSSAKKHQAKQLDFSLSRGILFSGIILLIAAIVLFMFSINSVTIILSTLLGLAFIAIAVTGALGQLYRYEQHAVDDDKDDMLERADFGSTVLSMVAHLIFWR